MLCALFEVELRARERREQQLGQSERSSRGEQASAREKDHAERETYAELDQSDSQSSAGTILGGMGRVKEVGEEET